ncbi:MAG TPA: hypothetical protein DIT28_16550 [Oxalobacteraceae bacterium]|nr:hypothetical protein [Oxalobacteraceae bacterium]
MGNSDQGGASVSGIGQGGTGGSLEFQPRAAEEVPGIRLTSKICELCGRGFLRDAQQRECKACEAKLALPAEPIPIFTEADSCAYDGKYPKMHAAAVERNRKQREARVTIQ